MLKNKLLNNSIFSTAAGLLLFKLLMDVMYVIYICPKHNNRGFIYEPTAESILMSWGATLLILPFLRNLYESENSSAKVISFWVFVSFVPSVSVFSFLNVDFLLWELFLVYWLVLLLALQWLSRIKLPPIPETIGRYRGHILMTIAIGFSAVIVFVSAYYFKFRFSLNVGHVTELRSSYKEVKMAGIFNYLLPVAGTILPLILLYFLANRKYLMSIILFAVLLIDFSIAGHRVILIKLAVCFFGYFAYKYIKAKYFPWFFGGVIVVALLIYFATDVTFFSSLVRRAFYVPSILNVRYYDFFLVNPADYYHQGIIGTLTGSPSHYSSSISKIIGETYMGISSGNNANNGLFSDAISNFGIHLVFIQALLLAIYLKIFDWSTQKIDEKYAFLPVFLFAQVLMSALITTSIITHGLLLLILVLCLFPRKTPSNA